MADCKLRDDCGFYRDFGARKSNTWRGLIGFYCRGRGVELCERRKIYLGCNFFPADDIMPTGIEVPKAFRALE